MQYLFDSAIGLPTTLPVLPIGPPLPPVNVVLVPPPAQLNHNGTTTSYSTISAAIDAAGNGDTITLAAGDYTGQGSLNFAGKDLTLKSAVAGSSVTVSSLIQSGGDLTVDGLTIRATAHDPSYPGENKTTGISFAGDSADHLTVLNTKISVAAVVDALDDDGTIPPQGVGVDVSAGSGNVTITNVTVNNFTGYGWDQGTAYGVYINGSADISRSVTITGSAFDPGTYKNAGIALEGQPPAGVTISGNSFGAPGTSPGSIRIFDFSNQFEGELNYSGISNNTFALSTNNNGWAAISNETDYYDDVETSVTTGRNAIRLDSDTVVQFDSQTIAQNTYPTRTLVGDGAANLLIDNYYGGKLDGKGGDDILFGGAGADTYTGGAGSDLIFGSRYDLGGDTITDFSAGDKIHFTDGGTITNAAVVDGALKVTFAGYPWWEAKAFANMPGLEIFLPMENTVTINLDAVPTGEVKFSGHDVYIEAPPAPQPTPVTPTEPTPPAPLFTPTPTPTPTPSVVTQPNPDGSSTLTLTTPQTPEQLAFLATPGVDNVASPFSVTLPNGIENVTLTGTGNVNATGNSGANQITGNVGNNTLVGDPVSAGGSTARPDGVAEALGDGTTAAAPGDTISGGFGNDLVYGNLGDDLLYGNQDNDTIFGGQNNDTIFGGQNEDVLHGNKGDDQLFGNKGADRLFGEEGNDFLHGGQNSDTLDGGAGNDTLNGGLDFNIVTGGTGADRFVHTATGIDTITDFSFADGDRIDTGGHAYAVGQNASGQATLFFADGGAIVLQGITPDAFQAGFVA